MKVGFIEGVKGCNGYNNFSHNESGNSEVQAKPEFGYQNSVKLIGHSGAHKHNCALESLSMQIFSLFL